MIDTFTGLVAHYSEGSTVEEKNYFYSEKLQKRCATNWAELDLDQVVALELYFNGVSKVKVSKTENPDIGPQDWFFSHTGIADMTGGDPKTIQRNIGYKKDGLLYVSSVDEENGSVKVDIRKL